MSSGGSAPTPIGVVIADDDRRVRESLSELINDHPRLQTIGAGASGDEAAVLCATHRPPLAVIDVMMPTGGTEAIEAILAVSPTTRIVAFTARADRRTRERLLASGAQLVVAKGSGVDITRALYELAQPTTDTDPSHSI